MLSSYDFWQYWRNVDDADVARFLKIFTELPVAEIDRLAADNINEAKKTLATEVTALVRGRDKAEEAAETARRTFEEGAFAANLPSVEVEAAQLDAGLGVLTAFVTAGLVASNGEARRQLKGGGLRVNDTAISDERATLTRADLSDEGAIKLSLGKKKHVLLKPRG